MSERELRRDLPGRSGPAHDENQTSASHGREELEGLLAAADEVLDSLGPRSAEEYLQQNRQRGGQ